MTEKNQVQATEIQDAALEDARGGYFTITLNDFATSRFAKPSIGADSFAAEEELMALRKRPTRIEKGPLDGVEEAGALRKRPTR